MPWGHATGVGSLPGVDFEWATATVLSQLPEFPHLPELPERGPWFNMVGRGCAVLLDLPAELSIDHWALARSSSRSGSDLRRARSGMDEDLQRFAESLHERADGELVGVKVQVCGPLTLSSCVELPNGQAALSDSSAVRDIVLSLTEGIALYLNQAAQYFPSSINVVLQIDEPALPSVMAGSVPTASGLGTYRAIDAREAGEFLRTVVVGVREKAPAIAIHCCAPDPPINLIDQAGADAVSIDVSLLDVASGTAEELGTWLEDGHGLIAGLELSVATTRLSDGNPGDPVRVSHTLETLMGADWLAERGREQVAVSPRCGLANVPIANVAGVYEQARIAQQKLNSETG